MYTENINVNVFKIGIFSFIALISIAILSFMVDKFEFFNAKGQPYIIKFESLGGVSLSTPIRLNGDIPIGKIAKIHMPDPLKNTVNVHILIHDATINKILKKKEKVLFFISDNNPFGRKYLLLKFSPNGMAFNYDTTGSPTIQGISKPNINSLVKQVDNILHNVDKLLENPIQSIINKIETTVDKADITTIIQKFKNSMNNLEATSFNIRILAERKLPNITTTIETFLRSIATSGNILQSNLLQITPKLQKISNQLQHFSNNLNNPEKPIGYLSQSKRLQKQLEQTMGNLESLTLSVKHILSGERFKNKKLGEF